LAANTLTNFYIVSQLDAKLLAAKEASTWLAKRLTQLRAEAQASARAVEIFRKDNNLLQGSGESTLVEQEIAELNLRSVGEQTTLAEMEARLRLVENLLKSQNGVESVSEVLNSPLIISLREQEAELERTVAEMAGVYGDQHPNMINLRVELSNFHQKIRTEVNKLIQGLRNELSIARSRARSLNTVLEQRREALGDLNTGEVELQSLQREADASHNLLEIVLARFKEISAQQDFQKADATTLARASLPLYPSFPNKPLLLSLAVICSIFLGTLIAITVDQSDSGLRSMEQVEKLIGTTPLGLIPALNEIGQIGKDPAKYIVKHPTSAYSESIRTLYTNLSYTAGDRPPKTLMVTSTVPREGKTSISVSLARSLAIYGRNVLVLDCDFRRGTVHKAFGVSPTPGLTDYLAGTAALEEVLRHDPETGANFIPVGTRSSTPLSFRAHSKLETLIGGFADSENYHLVILDSAPILAVSDTRMLAKLVDETLLVVRWAKTRRELVKRALSQVMGTGCKVSGIVLSMVDVKRHSQYDFSDSGLYTGRMGRYYTN
jgi:capsular exopolysaccharide synthesis family protein